MNEDKGNVYGNEFGYSALIVKQRHKVKVVDMPVGGRGSSGRFQKYIDAAATMPIGKAVLIDEPELQQPDASAAMAIKQRGLKGKFGVIKRQGKAYIIRKEV